MLANMVIMVECIETVNYSIQALTDPVNWAIEPPRGKTNNVVSDQVRHKPSCTSTEAG